MDAWCAFDGDDVDTFFEKFDHPDGYVAARIAELTREWEDATGETASDYALSGDDWRFGLNDDEAEEIVRLIDYQEGGAA